MYLYFSTSFIDAMEKQIALTALMRQTAMWYILVKVSSQTSIHKFHNF